MSERCENKKCTKLATTISHMTEGGKRLTCRPCATKLLAHGRAYLTADIKRDHART